MGTRVIGVILATAVGVALGLFVYQKWLLPKTGIAGSATVPAAPVVPQTIDQLT